MRFAAALALLLAACTVRVEMVVRSQPVAPPPADAPEAQPAFVGFAMKEPIPCALRVTAGSDDPCYAATVHANCQATGSGAGVCW